MRLEITFQLVEKPKDPIEALSMAPFRIKAGNIEMDMGLTQSRQLLKPKQDKRLWREVKKGDGKVPVSVNFELDAKQILILLKFAIPKVDLEVEKVIDNGKETLIDQETARDLRTRGLWR